MTATSAYLTVQEVAATAGVSTKTVRRAITSGQLAAYRVGARVRIRHDHAQAWIEHDPITPTPTSEHQPRARTGLPPAQHGGFADSMTIYQKARAG